MPARLDKATGPFTRSRPNRTPTGLEQPKTGPTTHSRHYIAAAGLLHGGAAAARSAGTDVGLVIPTAIGWHAERFGLYTLELHIDGCRQRSIPISVRDVADLSGQPENRV
jgi:hypothetical protein